VLDWAPWRRGFTTAHYVTLAVAFVILLYVDRHQWFFFDEWEFLATRGLGGQSLRLFFPHNEHWSTIPILVFRGLYAIFGLRTYVPYLVVLLLLHLGTAFLLWRVMFRSGADGWVATALTGVFLLLGAGYENLIWAFQIGFVTSTLCGAAMLILADHDRPFGARDVAVWLVAVVGLMSSGIGITMVAVAATVALLRRGWRAALITLSIPAVVYLAWLAAVGHEGFVATHVTKSTILLVPDFVWRGLTATVDGATGLTGFGAVAIIGITVWLMYNHRRAQVLAPAFAGAIGAVIFFVLTGLGRAAFGIDEAASPRYIYVATALLLPITAVILSHVARRALVVQLAIVVLALFAAVHGLSGLNAQAGSFGAIKQRSKQQILAGAQLIASGAPTIGAHPDPQWAPDLTASDLAVMLHAGALPSIEGLTRANQLDAVLALQVDTAATPEVTSAGAATVSAGSGGFLRPLPDGCVQAETYGAAHNLLLRFSGPASVQLSTAASETVLTYLSLPPDASQSDPRNLTFIAGTPVYLSSVVAGDTVTLYLPAVGMRVCGANPATLNG